MNDEAMEAKLVQKTAHMLQTARRVIEKLNADKDEFQEEPSLSDLVLVAQIIAQTTTLDRLGEMGVPGIQTSGLGRTHSFPEEPVEQSLGPAIAIGMPMMPDLTVLWTPDGWWIHPHPEFKLEPICCESQEALASALQQLSVVCGQHRIPPTPSEEPE